MDDLRITPTPKGLIVQMPAVTAELFSCPDGWLVGQFAHTGRLSRREIEHMIFAAMPDLVPVPMEKRYSVIGDSASLSARQ